MCASCQDSLPGNLPLVTKANWPKCCKPQKEIQAYEKVIRVVEHRGDRGDQEGVDGRPPTFRLRRITGWDSKACLWARVSRLGLCRRAFSRFLRPCIPAVSFSLLLLAIRVSGNGIQALRMKFYPASKDPWFCDAGFSSYHYRFKVFHGLSASQDIF